MTDLQKKNMYYWLNVLLANVAPIVVLSLKYELVGVAGRSLGYKLTVFGVALFIWLVLKFWSDFVDMVYNMDEGMFRETLLSASEIGPYLLVIATVVVAGVFLEDVQFIAYTLGLGKLLGVFFSAKHQFYRRKIRIARGDRRVLSDGRKRQR
jgi:hypothetical protein